jgi:hypothetical protein
MYMIIFGLMQFGTDICGRTYLQEANRQGRHCYAIQTRMDWLCLWNNCAGHLVSSSAALHFLTKMSKKCKSISHIANQVKNQQNTISIEDKLDVISWLDKDEQIVDMCHNVRPTHSSVHTIHDNTDRVKGSAEAGTKVCSQTATSLSEWTLQKTLRMTVT